MKKIICNNCNKELPLDSKFCQYCGSKDIVEVEEKVETLEEENTITKKCYDCGKELPLDSKFCQYCGSKNVIEIKKDAPKSINNETNIVNNVEYKTNDRKNDGNNFKVPFIIACVVAVIIMMFAISSYESQNEKITKLNDDVANAQEKVDTYGYKASKYTSVETTANNIIYNDFRADTYFVKGTIATVNIYCNFNYYGEFTLYPSIQGNGINLTWGEWSGTGSNYHTQMNLTCSPTGYGVITLTNSVNNHTIKIFVTGN